MERTRIDQRPVQETPLQPSLPLRALLFKKLKSTKMKDSPKHTLGPEAPEPRTPPRSRSILGYKVGRSLRTRKRADASHTCPLSTYLHARARYRETCRYMTTAPLFLDSWRLEVRRPG